MKKILLLLLFIPLVFSCSKDPVIHTLTTSANPTDGGTVSPTTKEYEQGESATITAFPSYSYEFLNWSNGLGTSNSTTVVMDSDKSITANFNKKTPLRIKFEVDYMWDEKAYFPYQTPVTNKDCGGFHQATVGFEYHSYDKFFATKGHQFSLDSLIIDFRKVTETIKIRITDRVETTGNVRKVPKKIGYIKIIGDTIGKSIHINFQKAGFHSWANPKPPIIYGDSNIDFSDLLFETKSTQTCAIAEKISEDFFKTVFVKGDVSKNAGYFEVNYSQENDNLLKGDKIPNHNLVISSDFKEYIYN